jgi:hypothetical protein
MTATGSIRVRLGLSVLGVFGVGVLLGAMQAPPPDLQAGLIAYWKLDDAASPAVDSAGSNIGTWIGGPTRTTSGFPPAIKFSDPACLAFDGVASYVAAGTDAALGPAQMTVSFWTKALSTPTQYDGAMGKTNLDQWTQGWGFFYDVPSNMDFFVGAWNVNVATATLVPTDWNHIVGTWDGSIVQIYVNGSAGTPGSYSGASTAGSNPFEIGRLGVDLYNINGLVDDVRIYNRVLSAEEISLLTQGWTSPATPGGLTATPAAGQVTLSWNASDAAATYTLMRSTTPGSGYLPIASGITGPAYVDAPLKTGTYYYVVAAANPAGTSPNSAEASASVVGLPPSTGGRDHKYCGMGTAGVPGPGVLAALVPALLWGLLLGRRRSASR